LFSSSCCELDTTSSSIKHGKYNDRQSTSYEQCCSMELGRILCTSVTNIRSQSKVLLCSSFRFIPYSFHFHSIFIKPYVYIIIQFILTCPISCTMIYSDEINQIISTPCRLSAHLHRNRPEQRAVCEYE
jgi:hypothetical protein